VHYWRPGCCAAPGPTDDVERAPGREKAQDRAAPWLGPLVLPMYQATLLLSSGPPVAYCAPLLPQSNRSLSACYTCGVQRSNHRPNSLTGITPIRPRRAFEEVILQLKQAVAEGRLAIGDRLPHERELAKLFGVSRQSVREGLRMLEAFGVLSARRGAGPESGWTVSADGTSGLSALLDLYSSLQRIPFSDLLEIRVALEMLSGRSASTRATPEQKAQLLAAAQRMVGITDAQQFLAADTEFHVTIARVSGNTLAPVLMEAIRESMARVMLVAFSKLEDWDSERELLAAEHLEIAGKIRASQGDSAAEALRSHICGFYGRVLSEPAYPNASFLAM
jgi:GntR family transcriptional repressor for pyruvate dehydrogenase complex